MTGFGAQIPNIVSVSLPELILLAAISSGLVLGAILKDRFDKFSFIFATLSLVLASLASLVSLTPDQAFTGCLQPGISPCPSDQMFYLSRSHALVDYVRCLCYALTGLSVFMSYGYLRNHKAVKFEYPLLMLFAAFGVGVTLTSADLMTLYLGIETLSLSSYILATYMRSSAKSSEAGLKYFILGALASGLLLYGMSLVFGFGGSTQYSVIADTLGTEPSLGMTFGLVMMIIGLGFKVSAAPMHVWTPDVYEGAPTPVVSFFATVPKLSGLTILTIVLFEIFGDTIQDWQPILVILSAASMLIGTLAALSQNNLKRLLAYSSIANVGYALIGISAGTTLGIKSLLVFMTIYSITAMGLFLGVMLLRRRGGMVEAVSELSGLGKTQPLMASCLTLLIISVAGLPSGGLWGKIALFEAGIDANLTVLVILLVLTSVISLAYYLRLIYTMWVNPPVAQFEPVDDVLKSGIAVCALLAGIVLFIAIGVLDQFAQTASAAIIL